MHVYFTAALDETLGIVDAKMIMSNFAEKIPSLERGVAKVVSIFTLDRMQSRVVSFEEQVTSSFFNKYLVHLFYYFIVFLLCLQTYLSLFCQVTSIRLALSKILEEEEEWRNSAEVLCGIPLESGQK